MHKAIIIICLICLFSSCSKRRADVVVSDKVKVAMVDSVVDFGDISDTKTLPRHTFVIKNVGSEPLVLTDVHTSCGCVSLTDYTKSPIAPGKKGFIKVSFDPKSQTKGHFSKVVAIHSNAINYVEALVIGNNLVK